MPAIVRLWMVVPKRNEGRQAQNGISIMLDNSVELLEHAIDYAKSHGYRIRTEILDGAAGGFCRIGNAPCIFLDHSSTAAQQLAEIMQVLEQVAATHSLALSLQSS